ncbi:MAG: HEAT repeat domain-containing protein [Planctomycetota bacterium]
MSLHELATSSRGRVLLVVGARASERVGVPQPSGSSGYAISLEGALKTGLTTTRGNTDATRAVLDIAAAAGRALPVLIHALGDEDAQRAFLSALWEGIPPSDVHRAIASLVKAGVVNTVVNTSYDGLVAKALEQAGVDVDVADLAGPAPTGGRKPVLVSVDPLAAIGASDAAVASVAAQTLGAWIRRRGECGLVLLVGTDPGPLLDAVLAAVAANEAGNAIPVVAVASRAVVAVPPPLTLEAPDGTAADVLAQLCRDLDLADRLPVVASRGRINRVLDHELDAKPWLLSTPLIGDYEPLLEYVPAVSVRFIVLMLMLFAMGVTGWNAWSYFSYRSAIAGLRGEFDTLRATFDEDRYANSRAANADVEELIGRVRERQMNEFLILGAVKSAGDSLRDTLADDMRAFDDAEIDLYVYLQQLRDQIEHDQRYNAFGVFPDPQLELTGHPRNHNDRRDDDALIPLSKLLDNNQLPVLEATRDLVLDVLEKRLAEGALAAGRIPVITPLVGYDGGSLEARVVQSIRDTGGFEADDLSPDAVRAWLESKRMWLVFSRLDQARVRSQTANAIETMRETFPGNHCLVSTGAADFKPDEFPGSPVMAVRSFEPLAVLRWLEGDGGRAGLASALRRRLNLLDVARDPLYLSLVARHWDATGELPPSWMQLLDMFIDDYLTAHDDRRRREIEARDRRRQAAEDAGQSFKEAPLRPVQLGVSARKQMFARWGRYLLFHNTTTLSRDRAAREVARFLSPVTAADEYMTADEVFADEPGMPQLLAAEPLMDELLATGLIATAPDNGLRFADSELHHFFCAFSAQDLRLEQWRHFEQVWNRPVDDYLVHVAGLGGRQRIVRLAFAELQANWANGPDRLGGGATQLLTVARMAAQQADLIPALESAITAALIEAVHSPFRRLSQAGLEGFVQLGRPAAFDRLFRDLESAPDDLAAGIIEVAGRSLLPEALAVLTHDYQRHATDPARVRACLAAIARIGTAEALAWLDALLGDPRTPATVWRDAAREALIQRLPIGDPAALLERIRSDPAGYGELAAYLAYFDSDDALATAVTALRATGAAEWKPAVADGLAQFSSDRLWTALDQLLADPAADSWGAVAAAGRFEERGVPLVWRAIDQHVARGDITALARSVAALQMLRQAGLAGDGLATRLTPRRDWLQQQMSSAAVEPGQLLTVLRALAAEPAGHDLLLAMLPDGGAVPPAALVRGLGFTHQADVLARLIPLAAVADEQVARAAVAALGDVPTAEARDALQDLAAGNGPLAWLALESLAGNWPHAGVAPFVAALQRNDPDAWRAAACLGRVGSPWGVKPLCEWLGDPTHAHREAAADALARIAEPEAVNALGRCALDPGTPPEVVIAAVRALGVLGIGPGLASALERLALAADNPLIRQAAYDAWWSVTCR